MWALLVSFLTKIPALLTPLSGVLTGINIVAAFQSLVSNIKKNWRFYLPILLVVLQLGTCFGWYRDHGLLVKEKAAHQLDINNFKNAEAVATAQAKAEKAVLQKESKANADQADANYSALLTKYRANLVRYETHNGATSAAGNNQLPSAQSSDGPGAGSEVPSGSITITTDDAQICAVNTARLQAVHDWALNPPKDGTQP